MLDRRRNHFSFQEIAHHWAREPNQRYSSDEILTDLVVAFWRGDFSGDEIGWNANDWFLKRSDNDYPPKPLQNKYRKIQGEKFSDFEPISRNEAFELLIACGDQYAEELIGCSDADTFDALAHKTIEDYSEAGRFSVGTLMLTKKALKIWSENRGVKSPHFANSIKPSETRFNETHQSLRPIQEPVSSQNTAETMEVKRDRERIEAILYEGAKILREDNTLSCRSIASKMIRLGDGQKLNGYGYDAIRSILSGRYGPALRLGFLRAGITGKYNGKHR